MQKNKIYCLESLRGIAALHIAIFHFSQEENNLFKNFDYISASYLMVDLFFVLSGYVIAYNYTNKINSISTLLKFQIKRFFRLYPLHVATLLFFLLYEIVIFLYPIHFNKIAFSINNITAFLNNIFLTHGIFLNQPTFNTPSWSISVEFYSYLFFQYMMLV